jgi:hypothetical protein
MLLATQRFLTNRHKVRPVVVAAVAALSLAAAAHSATLTLVSREAVQTTSCEAHVLEDGAAEQIVSCGRPIHTSGKHAVGWIETPASITPFLTDVTAGGEVLVAPGVPSGRIELMRGHELRPGERIRLVSLETPKISSTSHLLFEREVASRDARPRMPVGRAVALLIDDKGRAVAASRPITVSATEQAAVWPTLPEGSGRILVASLKRRRPAERPEQNRVTITAVDPREAHKPDVFVNSADSMFAVWYGLIGTNARLTIEPEEGRLGRDTVTLAPGTLTMVTETLQGLPTLTVAISPLPPQSRGIHEQMSLAVTPVAQQTKIIRSLAVEPGKSYSLGSLPASILELDVRLGDFLIYKQVDLSSGDDVTVEIGLEPIVVAGTVYRGDTPTRAQVRFQQKDRAMVLDTDDQGYYEVTLWQRRRYVIDTTLPDRPEVPPFSQNVLISAPRTLDIHVPDNSLSARLYDAESGKPIDGARIAIMNQWMDDAGSHSASITVLSKGELTALPPQRIGTTQISAHAEGYSGFQPISLSIDENLHERVIDIPMKKVGDLTRVQLKLEGDASAAGAEMATWMPSGEIAWLGTADEAGQIAVPNTIAGQRLLIRHPMGASVVVLFAPGEPVAISLDQPALPLVIKVVHRDQSRIGTSAAMLSVWCGSVRLTGPIAAFATWSMGATSADGVWIGRGLARESVRLLFTRTVAVQQVSSGSLDGLATTIPYPWSSVTSVVLADE